MLACIELNMTIISLNLGFHLSPHSTPKNAEEEKCYEMAHTFNLSLGLLNLVKVINRSDFKRCKYIFMICY